MWIHKQKNWPNFTWDTEILTPLLVETRHRQGRLLGRMDALGFELKQEASLNILTNDVVKSSAIEGEILNPEEVRSSIARRLGIDVVGLGTVSRNVEGIVEILLDATQNFKAPLTADRLFAWHAALFPTGRNGMQQITVGAWRPIGKGDMKVVSGPIGREKVHFRAPIAERVEMEMKTFLTEMEAPPRYDLLLKAAVSHLWFVTIHPFQDGNGRIGRAVADMILAQADGVSERFYSMSAQIESERKAYYHQLEHQQRGNLDITEWLGWFLECLGRAIDGAQDTLNAVIYKARLWDVVKQERVNERQRLILNRMLNGFKGHMNTSKYAKIAKCSSDTALRDLKELLHWHVMVQNPGGGRSTSYRLATLEEL